MNSKLTEICYNLSSILTGLRNYKCVDENGRNIVSIGIANVNSYVDLLVPICAEFEDSGRMLFVNILEVCANNLSKHLIEKQWDLIRAEADCNHNVPTIIESQKIELIRFYMDSERTFYERHLPDAIVRLYVPIWDKLNEYY